MTPHATPIAGLWLLDTPIARDERGEFERLFCRDALAAIRPGLDFVQSNRSRTRVRGTLRGMHYQRAPHAEAKLIKCVRGTVFDVTVDLRRGSPTFLAWHAVPLAEGDGRAVLIPEGCAHGFQATSDDAELVYFHSAAYRPASEAGLLADDPRLGIAWPLPIGARSARDLAHAPLAHDFAGEPA